MKKDRIDWLLFGLTVFLCLFGLLAIFDASAIMAQRTFNDQFFYLKKQLVWFALGIIAMISFSKINYHYFKKMALPLLIFSFIGLIAVLVPDLGIKKMGAQRWLGINGLSFQPSELAKLALVLYGASFFGTYLPFYSHRHLKSSPPQKEHSFWPFLVINILMAALIILEPDLGTAVIIIALGLTICFLANIPSWKLLVVLLTGLVLGINLVLFSPYRQQRLQTFLNPNRDPQGASYHVHQILIALGSGGIWGQGIGQGKQKYIYLPEVATDSIFAVVAEELGFVGATTLIIIFALLVFRCLHLANQAPDQFGKLLTAGVGIALGFQILINLGAMVTILPLTGIPLPLVSYGGSSLLVTMTGLGMVLSVSRERVRKKEKF